MNELTGRRVLIVEDEPIVAMCLEDVLFELGCETIGPVGRLSEALLLAENENFDAAILDINLGGERSEPIANKLRSRTIPFAFASGYGTGPDGFEAPLISKPYRAADVQNVLRQLLT